MTALAVSESLNGRGSDGRGASSAQLAPSGAADIDNDPFRLRLLGGFELSCGDDLVPLPVGTQRLVAFLALHTRALQRAYVAGKLWFDGTQGDACASLRSALWRGRRCATSLIEVTRSQLRLAPYVSVDVREQVSLAYRVLGRHGEIGEDVRCVLEGELLPDWYDDWVEFERARLRQLRLHALEALADRLMRAARYGEAVEAAMAALRDEPLRESAHFMLLSVYIAEGNLSEACDHFERYRDALRRRMGLQPPREMLELLRNSTAAVTLPRTSGATHLRGT